MDQTTYELVRPEFTFNFNGKEYRLRKANIRKAIEYRQKMDELQKEKDPASDPKLAAFCIYIMLKDQDPDITEDYIYDNLPGDFDMMDLLTVLGFMNPQKKEFAKKLQAVIDQKLISENSSPSSATGPVGQ